MRFPKLIERFKSTQVHAVITPPEGAAGAGGWNNHYNFLKLIGGSKPKPSTTSSSSSIFLAESLLLAYGLPTHDLIEPSIHPYLMPTNFVETLADFYRRSETEQEASLCFLEQYSVLRCTGDPKLLRRCLRHALRSDDVHTKLVLSAWLRFERREDDLASADDSFCDDDDLQDCGKLSLFISSSTSTSASSQIELETEEEESDDVVVFLVGNEQVRCIRSKMAALSFPFAAMLYGSFVESTGGSIDFSHNGISCEGMKAVEVYSRTKQLNSFTPPPDMIVMELLSFANRFCCEDLKFVCDKHLASQVVNIDDALIWMDFGLEETAHLLVGSCLQAILRDLPSSLHIPKVTRLICTCEGRQRLSLVGHSSFLLYYFLSQVAFEEEEEDSIVSDTSLMLSCRLLECAVDKWQRALALHQLGCIQLERGEFKEAQTCFEEAVLAGHVYSTAGCARAKYKQGQRYAAYKMIDSLIVTTEKAPLGWMFQERSLYGVRAEDRILDSYNATKLDPTLPFPYKLRALAKVEEKQMEEAISEVDKIIGFKLSADCLELRAWLLIAVENYSGAIRDIRALLTLEPNYMVFGGKLSGKQLVDELVRLRLRLSHKIEPCSQADCWMQLYDRWSCVDDIGSLAVIHHMLSNDPKKSLLWFRQSLLLLRLNSQKAAMRSLRLARNYSSSEHERVVYEGWILYDTGNRDEALSRAEKSISIQRSFEAFFLKAYILADTTLDVDSSSYVIHLLEEALRCPSDGLRKGQALNNLASIYVDCGKLELAATCYKNALEIKHTRAHQGLARVYHMKNQRQLAYCEMSQLIVKAQYKASAYEKRSEYCCDREMARADLNVATQLDPLRTYPYRYRAAVLMDDQREGEAIEELTRGIGFKPDLQMLHLRAAFYESMGNLPSALQDCKAALCLDPTHLDTLHLYQRALDRQKERSAAACILID